MLEENKNLKDNLSPTPPHLNKMGRGEGWGAFYTKTNKLITALYMVTDIMEKEEPLRNKLRNLGADIISDIYSLPECADGKINAIISFLDIASAINLISEMNCNILKKEFLQLKQSLRESSKQDLTLSELFQDDERPPLSSGHLPLGRGRENSIGRIGVQKGSTLLKALKEIRMSDKGSFDALKGQRRDLILQTIKDKPDGVSIKDIAFALRNSGKECGEKTLQRELVSMAGDGVLKKIGEKRWSRYFLPA